MNEEMSYHRIAAQFYNRPLLLLPSAAETISAFLLSRVGARGRGNVAAESGGESRQFFEPTRSPDGAIESHAPRASRFYGETPLDENSRPLPFRRTAEGVAIITLVGEFVNRGAWVGASSGLISYEGFKFQMQRAAADQRTRAIMLDIESPGGEAVGAFEAAAAVRAASAIKPVVAVVNGMAASAAYAIASGAGRIVSMPTGMSGSIGVVMMHVDFSKALEVAGVKPTLIFAGEHKVDGNPFEPLPKDVQADFQREVMSFYDQFVAAVAAGRKAMSEKQIRDTQARVFTGDDAVNARLADSVGTFEEVLADLTRGLSSRLSPSIQPKGLQMDKNEGAPAAEVVGSTATATATLPKPAATTVAELSAASPVLVSQIQGIAATAERERILGIEAIAVPGHEALVANMKADGKTTPDQAARHILEAEKKTRGTHLNAIKGVEDEGKKVVAAPSAGARPETPPKATTPEGWKAEYAASEALQSEFLSVANYVAFKTAESQGRVKRLVQRAS